MISSAIVIGAGIGGLATAHSLRRVGIEAAVFERAPELRRVQVGGGFHLWTNAVRALQALGLDGAVQKIGTPIEVTEYRNAQGRILATWPVGELGRQLAARDVGVNRRDLHRVLGEAQPDGAVRVGMELHSFEQDAAGVTARFADGTEERADVLIGADGLRSTVRRRMLGAESPRFAGYTQWQTTMEPTEDFIPKGIEHVVFGPASRAILHHVGGGELFWAGVIYGPEGSASQRKDGRKQMLLDAFRGWENPIGAAIDATPEERIVGLDIYDRTPVKRWGEGRVTLVGDAAHAMTTNLSQGGCQALEDAAVLARSLREGPNVEGALRAYEARRVPRTGALVKRSRNIAKLGAWRSPLACAARDRMLKTVLSGPGLKDHRKFVAAPL
jgi:2-polyprenyl-6-methoxyphenol hydroxylase-like FAD-dependent oxidoreductase